MNPCSVDIAYMLSTFRPDLGFVTTGGGRNTFIGIEPVKPDLTLAIFDVPGRMSKLGMDRAENWDRPSVQLRCRGLEYMETWQRARSVVEYFEGLANVTVSGARYILFYVDRGQGFLDQDGNNRWRFITSFEVRRAPAN